VPVALVMRRPLLGIAIPIAAEMHVGGVNEAQGTSGRWHAEQYATRAPILRERTTRAAGGRRGGGPGGGPPVPHRFSQLAEEAAGGFFRRLRGGSRGL
jgi:hypothetical protein